MPSIIIRILYKGYCQQNKMLPKVKNMKTAMHYSIENLPAYLQLVCSSIILKLDE